MRSQPSRSCPRDDEVMTPGPLAARIVQHFAPTGSCLDPCRGTGAFYDAMPPDDRAWCEIREGRDFYMWTDPVAWILTNPPWGQFQRFLAHALDLAPNVVFLATVNHAWTKRRVQIWTAAHHLAEVVLIDTPPSFPASGFQLGVLYWQAGPGPTQITDWRTL